MSNVAIWRALREVWVLRIRRQGWSDVRPMFTMCAHIDRTGRTNTGFVLSIPWTREEIDTIKRHQTKQFIRKLSVSGFYREISNASIRAY